MKLTNTNATELNRLRCLVHGDSGIGKTTSLGTLPAHTVLAVCERSVIPLRDKDMPVLHVESWGDVRRLMTMFRNDLDDAEIKRIRDGGYGDALDVCQAAKTLAVDSLTELSELCKRHIIEVDRKRLLTERTGKDRMEKVYDDLMVMEDWNLYQTRIKSMISGLAHLPVHIVMTSLSSYLENKKTGEMKWAPAVNGRLAFECPAHFDCVFHMQNQEDNRVWLTANDDEYLCKDASGVLNKYEDPNWTDVFKKILVDKKKPQTAAKTKKEAASATS